MNYISKFFLWCSGTDWRIIKEYDSFDQLKYVAIGIAVLLTSIIAGFSSYFAFELVFSSEEYASNINSILFSVLWGILILNTDRLIVLSITNSNNSISFYFGVLFRLTIAILIGITISKPLELKLYKSRIKDKIVIINDSLKQKRIENFENFITDNFKKVDSDYSKELTRLSNLINQSKKKYDSLQTALINEAQGKKGTKIYGNGKVAKLIKKEVSDSKRIFETYKTNRNILKDTIRSTKERIKQRILKKIKYNEAEFKLDTIGLLTNLEALGQLKNESTTMWWSITLITIIFVFIESIPVLSKVLIGKGVYEKEIETLKIYYIKKLKKKKKKKEKKDDVLFETDFDIWQLQNSKNKLKQENKINLSHSEITSKDEFFIKNVINILDEKRINEFERNLKNYNINNTNYSDFFNTILSNLTLIPQSTNNAYNKNIFNKKNRIKFNKFVLISKKYIKELFAFFVLIIIISIIFFSVYYYSNRDVKIALNTTGLVSVIIIFLFTAILEKSRIN